MVPTVAAVLAVAMIVGPDDPFGAFLFTAGILCVSSAVLPSPAWSWWFLLARRMTRRAVSAIVREPSGPRPSGRVRARMRQWRERLYFHLSRAEWDSRVQIGMSLWHTERLAYHLPNPEEWDEREAMPDLWPDGEWTGVIEEVRREEGWKP